MFQRPFLSFIEVLFVRKCLRFSSSQNCPTKELSSFRCCCAWIMHIPAIICTPEAVSQSCLRITRRRVWLPWGPFWQWHFIKRQFNLSLCWYSWTHFLYNSMQPAAASLQIGMAPKNKDRRPLNSSCWQLTRPILRENRLVPLLSPRWRTSCPPPRSRRWGSWWSRLCRGPSGTRRRCSCPSPSRWDHHWNNGIDKYVYNHWVRNENAKSKNV